MGTIVDFNSLPHPVFGEQRTVIGDICAVTLSRFTVEKGADISSQNIFLDDSLTRYFTILGAEYRKNSSVPVFRQ
jgi:hypothetical protein